MGLCSDTSWRRLQERRAERETARDVQRRAADRLQGRLGDLTATYEGRSNGTQRPSPTDRERPGS